MKTKEHKYPLALTWLMEKRGRLSIAGKPDLEVATPPEFKGHAGFWSPEDLLVSATSACLLTSFLSLAERNGLSLVSYQDDAEGTVSFVDGRLRFTRIVLRPKLRVAASDVERAHDLIQRAESICLISASLTCEVVLEPTIEGVAT